ncbi:glycosyltransferase [Shewanella baltica]|uniref:glycosyltransferase n=1 Tax=Shewanella baltica TaxID=62322 RepID=UPI003D791A73
MIRTLLFGAGPQAEFIYHTEQDEREFIAVLDNNSKVQGGYFFTLPIIAPEALNSLEYDEIIITTSRVTEVQQQLINKLHVQQDKIVVPQNLISKQLKPFRHQGTLAQAVAVLNHISSAPELSALELITDLGTLLSLQQHKHLDQTASELQFSLPYKQLDALAELLTIVLDRSQSTLQYTLNTMTSGLLAPVAMVVEIIPTIKGGRSFTLMFRGRYECHGLLLDLPSKGLFYVPRQLCLSLKLKAFGSITAKVPCETETYLNFIYDDWQCASVSASQADYTHRGLVNALATPPIWPEDLAGLFHGQEDVSVVTAVFNHEDTLAESLDSALLQVAPYRIHIYCFDDASTDNSSIILQQYQAKFSDRITVFTSLQNQGSGKKSFLFHRPDIRGRYWGFLAGDDFWLDVQKIYKQTSYLDSKPDAVGCCCDTVLFEQETQKESLVAAELERWNRFDSFLYASKVKMYTHTSSILWRNIWRERRGFFLPAEFEKSYAFGDFMLCHMMLAYGGEMHRLPRIMNCYRYTGKGVWSSLTKEQQQQSQKKVLQGVKRAAPLTLRLWYKFQPLRRRFTWLKKLLPGPVNER